MKEITCKHGEIAFIDDDDYHRAIKYNWYVVGGYPATTINKKHVKLHYFVLDVPPRKEIEIHHKNENTFDAQKHNLKIKTKSAHRKDHLKKRLQENQSAFYEWCRNKKIKIRGGSTRTLAWKMFKEDHGIFE